MQDKRLVSFLWYLISIMNLYINDFNIKLASYAAACRWEARSS